MSSGIAEREVGSRNQGVGLNGGGKDRGVGSNGGSNWS